jgi:hypothetical protein
MLLRSITVVPEAEAKYFNVVCVEVLEEDVGIPAVSHCEATSLAFCVAVGS